MSHTYRPLGIDIDKAREVFPSLSYAAYELEVLFRSYEASALRFRDDFLSLFPDRDIPSHRLDYTGSCLRRLLVLAENSRLDRRLRPLQRYNERACLTGYVLARLLRYDSAGGMTEDPDRHFPRYFAIGDPEAWEPLF